MDLPTVTVLLSSYNGEKYLAEQLNSLLNQQNVTLKILARDDGSTDNTMKIWNNYSDRYKITIYQGVNVGFRKSFLDLIKRTEIESEYYAFCDQDDVWLENKLEIAINKIKEYDAQCPTLYYSRTMRVGKTLENINDVFKKEYHTETFGAALVHTAAPGCTMVWNKSTMKYLKKYIPEYINSHDAWVLLVCLAVGGKVVYDNNSYILYRQHNNNAIGGINKLAKSKVSLCTYRLKKLFDFSSRYQIISSELLEGYSDVMDSENRALCELMTGGNESITKRVKILFSPRLKTPYFVINLKFIFRVLLNQF